MNRNCVPRRDNKSLVSEAQSEFPTPEKGRVLTLLHKNLNINSLFGCLSYLLWNNNLAERTNFTGNPRLNRALGARFKRPFWLAASNYYILTIAVTIAFFFLVWGILHDGREDTPWIGAGIAASALLFGAVLLREIFLRRARNRFLANQRRLDQNLLYVPLNLSAAERPDKLTLEKNSAWLKHIEKKSDAAKILARLPEGHKEVFDLCDDYLKTIALEIPLIGAGSPRIAAFLKGSEKIRKFHRFHLLQWAAIESRNLTQQARNRTKASEKIDAAQKAKDILEYALRFYPEEPTLTGSEIVLEEFLDTIKVSDWVERAEKAAFRGNQKRAIGLYEEALVYLRHNGVQNDDRQSAIEQVEIEIERLRQHL